MTMRKAVIDIKKILVMLSVGSGIALFPCVGCLGDRAGGNHVQQVLSLTLHSRAALMSRQAWVHIRHGHTCQKTHQRSVH